METQMQATTSGVRAGNVDDHEYDSFIHRMNERLELMVKGGEPVFQTDAAPYLWDIYLNSFPESTRQYHNCNACRHFIERFGGLVVIGANGKTSPAFWSSDYAGPDSAAIEAMVQRVKRARVTGVFLTGEVVLGTPKTGIWRHFALATPKHLIFKSPLLTPDQKAAEKGEDFKNVSRALAEFPRDVVQRALSLLRSDALFRSEKVLGVAEWLDTLHAACVDSNRANQVWRAVATAPAGFCHPRSSMIGTLLEDLIAGKPFEEVSRAFKAKMSPRTYQRPVAPPKPANIEHAEDVVRKLGIERSLERRFARLDEIVTLWTPPPAPEQSGGVFDHLKPKSGAATIHANAGKITWEKFKSQVLPHAKAIEVYVPPRGNFCGLLTAVHADAPPILQWDTEENRNPVSWYVHIGGSMAANWGLSHGWRPIYGLALQPHLLSGSNEHHGKHVVALISGMREVRKTSLCLFPEILKSELHGIRSTIEAHSRTRHPEQVENPACGLALPEGTLRVTDSAGVATAYEIDRWD